MLIHANLLEYAFVHQRLREHRLVDFVVPVFSVGDDIDDDILPECVSVLRGDLTNESHPLLNLIADSFTAPTATSMLRSYDPALSVVSTLFQTS